MTAMSTATDLIVVEEWAGWCHAGSTDKTYSVCLLSDARVVTEWGRRGAMAQSATPYQAGDPDAARRTFDAVVRDKSRKYDPVAFDVAPTWVPTFRGRYGCVLSDAGATQARGGVATPAAPPVSQGRERALRVAEVTAVASTTDLDMLLADQMWGLTEKANGQRCVVTVDAHGAVRAFNRSGFEVPNVPEAARALAGVGRPLTVDGERLEGVDAGRYVIFDLLASDGTDLTPVPFHTRLASLRTLLTAGGITAPQRATVGTGDGLVLLVPIYDQSKRQVLAALRDDGAEGVVLRHATAPYQPGRTPFIRKAKFIDDVDCVVIGVNTGNAAGSLRLGLVRPGDQAVIAVGNVRAGLTDADVNHIRALLDGGRYPVIRVRYLGARTTGLALVEPVTSLADLRDDKVAADCTTDQVTDGNHGKAALVAAAVPVLVWLT